LLSATSANEAPQNSKFPEVWNDFLQPLNSVPPVSSEVIVSTCHSITEEEDVMNSVKNIISSSIPPVFSRSDLNIDAEEREILNSTLETRHSHNYGK